MLKKKTTTKIKSSKKKGVSDAELSRRRNQSLRDKRRFQDSSNVLDSETLVVVNGERDGSTEVVGIRRINELDKVFDFIEAKRESVDDAAKRVVVDVKRFTVEAVNTSVASPVIALCSMGNTHKRSILAPAGKANVSFNPFSSLNGDTEINLLVPQGKAEVWFIIRCKVQVRYIY